jgi:hypothetical protein
MSENGLFFKLILTLSKRNNLLSYFIFTQPEVPECSGASPSLREATLYTQV